MRWISSSSLIPVHLIHLPTVYVCTEFQTFRPHSSKEKCDEKFNVWKLERKKNGEIKRWISSSSLIPVYKNLPTVHVCDKFQSSRPHSTREKCDEKFQCWELERKKNEEIMGWISSSSLIPVYMIHLRIVHVCTKFQSSRPYSSQEKCDKKFQCWKLERKKNEEIMRWIWAAVWFQYTWYICPLSMCVPSFNLLGLTVPEKSDEKFHCWKFERKKNEEIKGQISSSLNLVDMITSAHCPHVYQVSIF